MIDTSKAPLSQNQVIVLIIAVTALLGGGYNTLSSSFALIATSAVMMVGRTHSILPRKFNILFIGIFILGLCAFIHLPDKFVPVWRKSLWIDLNIPVPSTISINPLLSLEGLIFLTWGLLWVYHCLNQPFSLAERYTSSRFFSNAFIVLGFICVLFHLLNLHPSLWQSQQAPGFFANRNQSSIFFAMGALLTMACAFEDYKADKFSACMLRACGTFFLLLVMVRIGSRGGPILFLIGCFAWFVWLSLISKNGKQFCTGAAIFFLILTTFFLLGGHTMERILGVGGARDGYSNNLRLFIYKDTIHLINDHPLFGVGLENYQFAFPLYEKETHIQAEVIHPESDWLWLAAEMGLPALIGTVALIYLTVMRVLPFKREKTYVVRLMAFIAFLVFLLHGFFDVSGHRIGTFLVAAFLLKLALPEDIERKGSTRYGIFSASLAGVVAIIALAWLLSGLFQIPIPTKHSLEQTRKTIIEDLDSKRYSNALEKCGQALKFAPTCWYLYFYQGIANMECSRDNEALESFRQARALAPQFSSIRLQEGKLWLRNRPETALAVWVEALRLSDKVTSDLNWMLSRSKNIDLVWNGLREFAKQTPSTFLTYLHVAKDEDFKSDYQWVVNGKLDLKKFTAVQTKEFINLVTDRANKGDTINFLESDPNLIKYSWRWLAQANADKGDYQKAFKIVRKEGFSPSTLGENSIKSLSELKYDFQMNPYDTRAGLILLDRQMKMHLSTEALETIEMIKKGPKISPTVYFFEADAHAVKEDWENAWKAWVHYESSLRSSLIK